MERNITNNHVSRRMAGKIEKIGDNRPVGNAFIRFCDSEMSAERLSYAIAADKGGLTSNKNRFSGNLRCAPLR